MKATKVIAKYLANYAESVSPWLADFPQQRHFERCVIIPAFDEPASFTDHLSELAPQNTLLILILNCPDQCPSDQRQHTLQAKKHLADKGKIVWESPLGNSLQLVQTNNDNYWLTWDITHWSTENSAGFVQGASFVHGVGYARKLGMDSALHLFHQQQITNPFFLSTDADAHLPPSYFSATNGITNSIHTPSTGDKESYPGDMAGYIFPFRHQTDVHSTLFTASLPATLYEISLRYYVLGLRWANSPWGFHTVGSTLAIHAYHYAANRGFPKREAGEDFYLLNKIAKTGDVLSLKEPSITLSDRASHRVPFGTGPAVQRIQDLESIDREFMLYHPHCFLWLSQWLACIPDLMDKPIETVLAANCDEPEKIALVLRALKADKVIQHSRKQSKSTEDFCRHMLTWFDAFKTLKFIHQSRDNFLPSLSASDWTALVENGEIPFLCSSQASRIEEPSLQSFPKRVQQLSNRLLTLESETLPHKGGL